MAILYHTFLDAFTHLFFRRSWQELDARLSPSGPFPLLNSSILMKPSSDAGSDRGRSGQLSRQQQQQKRPKPCFPSMPDLPRSLPKDAGWVTEVGDFVCVHLINHGILPSPSPSHRYSSKYDLRLAGLAYHNCFSQIPGARPRTRGAGGGCSCRSLVRTTAACGCCWCGRGCPPGTWLPSSRRRREGGRGKGRQRQGSLSRFLKE